MPSRSNASISTCRGVLALGAVFATCFLLLISTRAEAQPVRLELTASGDLMLSRLPRVLDHVAIEPKLTTGLTTTFYFRVTAAQQDRVLGGADISLRYDLWEEVYLLTLRDGLGQTQVESQPAGRLTDWWSTLKIRLSSDEPLSSFSPGDVNEPLKLQVSLIVLPFSSGELADTKRWLSRTGATGRRRAPDPGGTPSSSHLFDLLLGTSLERKALFSKEWTVIVRPASSEPVEP